MNGSEQPLEKRAVWPQGVGVTHRLGMNGPEQPLKDTSTSLGMNSSEQLRAALGTR